MNGTYRFERVFRTGDGAELFAVVRTPRGFRVVSLEADAPESLPVVQAYYEEQVGKELTPPSVGRLRRQAVDFARKEAS